MKEVVEAVEPTAEAPVVEAAKPVVEDAAPIKETEDAAPIVEATTPVVEAVEPEIAAKPTIEPTAADKDKVVTFLQGSIDFFTNPSNKSMAHVAKTMWDDEGNTISVTKMLIEGQCRGKMMGGESSRLEVYNCESFVMFLLLLATKKFWDLLRK